MKFLDLVKHGFCALLLTIAVAASVPTNAWADCVNPPGREAEAIYNSTYKTLQFCDGSTWWSMKGGAAGTVPAGTQGSIQFYSGGILAYSSGLIFTSAGNLGVGTGTPAAMLHVTGDAQIDGTLTATVSAPTANSDPATKEYVDTAVAAGGGAGSLTVWNRTSCPTGWSTAYTGQAATLGQINQSNSPYPSGFSSIICISGGLTWSSTGTGNVKTRWWNGNGEQYSQALLSCAVCVK